MYCVKSFHVWFFLFCVVIGEKSFDEVRDYGLKSVNYQSKETLQKIEFAKYIYSRQDNTIEKKEHTQGKVKKGGRFRRAATAHEDRLWDYGVIPYEIDETFTGRKTLLRRAMRHWENFTCIKFVERNVQEHANYIYFTEKSCGCCSFFVGKRGDGGQAVSIAPICDFGNILHELGHAIGFWHEHSRPDRDEHVKIIKENIKRGWEDNFSKLKEDEVNTLGSIYDYGSIMHYSRNGFSRRVYLDTIQPIDSENKIYDIGQRVRLSQGDIQQTNRLYKCLKCGRTFQEQSGVISSSTYHTSDNEQTCEWRITATNGEKLVLNFVELEIEESPDCSNYIEIKDGYWYKSTLLTKLCDGKNLKSITSTGNRILITSFAKNPKRFRFTVKYKATCGGEMFLENEEYIESPNYPDEYEPNKECVWKISAPRNYKVFLKFSFFELEMHDACLYDRVEIRDGFSTDSKILGIHCGYNLPLEVLSSSENLLLRFVSDASVQKGGFSVKVIKEYDECAMMDHGCAHRCVNILNGYKCVCKIGFELQPDGKSCESTCGGLLKASSGTITSPSFPEVYPNNKTCVWEIQTQKNHRVVLNFTHFDLEGDNTDHVHKVCDFDKLEVFSKLEEEKIQHHGYFCGSKKPQPILSESSVITIIFRSDDSMQKTGFSASFSTDVDECSTNNGNCQHHCINTIGSYRCTCFDGYNLHNNNHNCTKGNCTYDVSSPFGTIGSPNYPNTYSNKQTCVWKFTTLPGHRVRVSFLVFSVEYQEECLYDRVELYDGHSSDDRTLGKFCGNEVPEPVTSSGTELYMTFKSDASTQRRGFWGTFSAVCGGVLGAEAKEKYIYSHAEFGGGNYGNGVDCDWVVKAESGSSVRLSFTSFDLEEDAECRYDYVEIIDGELAGRHMRYCGSRKLSDLLLGDVFLVRFRSDDTFGRKGFALVYRTVKKLDLEDVI